MAVLYLTEQGATLRKDGDRLVISKGGDTLQEIPAIKVDQIILFGNVNLTTPLIHYLLKQGIDCVFCSSYGRYHGRLISTESKFGALRQKQFMFHCNQICKLAIARDILRGKLFNQRTMLLRYARERENPEIQASLGEIQQAIEQLREPGDTNGLLGLEGYASMAYFKAFKVILKNDFGFHGRLKHPPRDPVNALLSFGYTLLAYNIQSAISTTGLDPFLGVLHATGYSRPSLALDLMEEFRPVIVDSVVLKLINSNIMVEDDFEKPRKDNAVLLNQQGMKKFIHHYEKRVQTEVIHPTDGVKASYRRCFELQARHMQRTILSKEAHYQPFLTK